MSPDSPDALPRPVRLRFLAECAAGVLDLFESVYPDDPRPRLAIEAARRAAEGNASREELAAARQGAIDARDIAWNEAAAAIKRFGRATNAALKLADKDASEAHAWRERARDCRTAAAAARTAGRETPAEAIRDAATARTWAAKGERWAASGEAMWNAKTRLRRLDDNARGAARDMADSAIAAGEAERLRLEALASRMAEEFRETQSEPARNAGMELF